MAKKGYCADCKLFKFLLFENESICRDCNDKKLAKNKSAPIALSQEELLKRNEERRENVRANSVTIMEKAGQVVMWFTKGGVATYKREAVHWADEISRLIWENFGPSMPGVFEGLIVCRDPENDMLFNPPGCHHIYKEVKSPMITVRPYKEWASTIGKGCVNDYKCVLLHEVIHYLHWRWTILPCDVEFYDDYEEVVGGSASSCVIPNFEEKENNGKKELNYKGDLKENAFRSKYGLDDRSYGEYSKFKEKEMLTKTRL